MRSRLVAMATVVSLLFALVPSLVAVCVGWQTSAMARMACCAKVHGDVSTAKADGCCQSGELRSHARAESGATSIVLPDVRLSGLATQPARRPATGHRQGPRTRAPEVATHILLATFLL